MSLKEKYDSLKKKASSTKSKIFVWLDKPRWKNRLFLYSVLGIVVILVSDYIFSYFGFLHTDIDSARYMLSALVQGEAAIVALVVTLSLVAVQLAAQSYSARVIEVFRKAPDLWILMGIYGVAIFYGLGVMKLINKDNILYFEMEISRAYYFGVFAFVALVPYMLKMFEMLKPSNVIDMLAERITKDNILSAIGDSTQPNVEKDPIQPIIDIVRSSLMKYDIETVREGLKAIGDPTEHLFKNETLEIEEERKVSMYLFIHLTGIGRLAANREDDDSTMAIVEILYKLGKQSAEQKFGNATKWALISLLDLINVSKEHELKVTEWFATIYLKEIEKTAIEHGLEVTIQEAGDFYELMNEAFNKLEKE